MTTEIDTPVIGICKLCRREKRLHESHFMPAALYAPGKKGSQYSTRSESGEYPDEIKAHLLCFDCEQRFDRRGESEVLKWLAPKAPNKFPLSDRLRVALHVAQVPSYLVFRGVDINLNTEMFAYFALSVAWRRSIHTWQIFDGSTLPACPLGDFGEQLRGYLSGESVFPPHTAVMVIACSDKFSRQYWYPPSNDVIFNCLVFEFLVRGVYFRILMGHHLPADAPEISCSQPYGRLLYGDCEEMTRQKLSILKPFPS